MRSFPVAVITVALLGSGSLRFPAALSHEVIGQIEFNNHCRNCHSARKGDNRLGPTMYAIFGSRAGQNPDYRNYSGGLAGLIWNEVTLDRFIAAPASLSPGTTMTYPPVADPRVRKRIITYLKSLRTP
jgi:cytochrome c